MKDKIAKWYSFKIWSKAMVADAVAKKVINADEYEEITCEVYEGSKG